MTEQSVHELRLVVTTPDYDEALSLPRSPRLARAGLVQLERGA